MQNIFPVKRLGFHHHHNKNFPNYSSGVPTFRHDYKGTKKSIKIFCHKGYFIGCIYFCTLVCFKMYIYCLTLLCYFNNDECVYFFKRKGTPFSFN